MRIVSWNVNGLRAVYKNGFSDWLKLIEADVICLQEIKAQKDQLPDDLQNLQGYYSYFNSATKKGYSGVAVYSRTKSEKVIRDLGIDRFDSEGRLLKLTFPGFSLWNVYLPHGGRQKENLPYKLQVYKALTEQLERTKNENTILIGDFNIAHQEIDLARPKQNQNNIMFTPIERAQIDELLSKGFIDTFRRFHQEGGQYTWLSYRPSARQKGLGWRIDYALVSEKMKLRLKSASIFPETYSSDHCPIILDIDEHFK